MSRPISGCWISKAALGDENAIARLIEAMDYNLKHGAFTVGGCNHTPPCPAPTEEQVKVLDKRVMEGVAALRKKNQAQQSASKKI